MTVKNVSNLAASVHARLQNHARATKRPFQELLQYYAMERFLYRLSSTPHRERFVLKGALIRISRVRARPTVRSRGGRCGARSSPKPPGVIAGRTCDEHRGLAHP